MSTISTSEISQLWNHLGSVWSNLSLEDKEFMETVWLAYADSVSKLYDELDVIKNNRCIDDIDPIITETGNFYDVIYATSDDDEYGSLINTFYNTSGQVCLPLNKIVISVSGVVNYYYQDASNECVAQNLISGVNYVLSGYNTLVFLNNPPFTLSQDYPVLSRSVIYIGSMETVNPQLFKIWGSLVGFNSDLFVKNAYNCWSQYSEGTREFELDKINHYKQLITGLRYWALHIPRLKTIRNGLGMARGLPFAYNSGLVVYSNVGGDKAYKFTVGDNQELYFDNSDDYFYINSGQTVGKYELLVNDYTIDDYVTNSGLILSHSDHISNARNRLILTTESGILNYLPSSYDQTLYDSYSATLIPRYHFFSNVENPITTPDMVSGINAWYRADSGIQLTVSGSVWSWSSMVGLPRALIRGTATPSVSQPHYVVFVSGLNGHPGVLFDGINHTLQISTSNWPDLVEPFTIIFVAAVPSSEPADRSSWIGLGGSTYGISTHGGVNYGLYRGGGHGASSTTVVWDGSFKRFRAEFGLSGVVSYSNLWVNDTHVITDANLLGEVNTQVSFGSRTSSNYKIETTIGEVMFFDRFLSSSELNLVDSYLKHRYNLFDEEA